MYVVPTPFRIAEGLAHQLTLILPAETEAKAGFIEVGNLLRKEAADLIVGYSFDLKNNELNPDKLPNPNAGREHLFRAWRLPGSPVSPVAMRRIQEIVIDDKDSEDGETSE
jgi:hypothetical protein